MPRQGVLNPINEVNKDKIKPKNTENQKQIYLSKMIQMMDHYDYTPDKIADKIIRQSYDDNTTLDNFIININNDINPAPPNDSPKQMDNDDNPRPKAYGLYPMPEPGKLSPKHIKLLVVI